VGQLPEGVAITPDGAHAYVTNFEDNTVSVITTASNTVTATIPVRTGPIGVAITPDGTHAYATNFDGSTVSVIDAASNTVVDTIPVGLFPQGVAITPDGTRAYVTNGGNNNVSVIDVANNTVVATIPVGNFPFAMAFATVTPQTQINALIATIQALVNGGTLNGGQGNSLIVSLQHALRSLPGQPLIDAANAVIHSLGG
jgi:YVTN family beta-propeller protein